MTNKVEYLFKKNVFAVAYPKTRKIYLHEDLSFYASLYKWVKSHEEREINNYSKSNKIVTKNDWLDTFRILKQPIVLIEFLVFWIFHPLFFFKWLWESIMFYITGKEISHQNF